MYFHMDIISESCIRKNGHFTDKDICLERSAGVFAIPKKLRAEIKQKTPDIEKEAHQRRVILVSEMFEEH